MGTFLYTMRLSRFTGCQLAILTPLLTLGLAALLALVLGALALLSGVSPLEVAWVFVQDALVSVVGAVLWLEFAALLFILIAVIGRWCVSQTAEQYNEPGSGTRLAPLLSVLCYRLNSARCFGLDALGSLHLPYLRNQTLASTSAGLSGASPLLL